MPEQTIQLDQDAERKAARLRWMWVGWWVVLFGLTHWPHPPQSPINVPHSDKLIHFVAYFTLALLGGRLWIARQRVLTAGWIAAWWGVYAAFGAIDELTQALPFINRNCDFWDWAADMAGASAALLITWSARDRSAEEPFE